MLDFQKYERTAAQLNQAANSLWSKVSFISVSEIIQNEIDLRKLDEVCWKLKDKTTEARRSFSKEVDSLPEEEYFDKYEQEHNETEDLFYKVDDKLDIIDSVISNLKEIEDKFEESEARGKFQDITRIHLGESIKLRRFS